MPSDWDYANRSALQAPTGTLLGCCKDVKQEIVHTLLLKKYGVSKKCITIMDRRQDSNVASTPAATSGPSALFICQESRRSHEETAWKRGGIEASLAIAMAMLRVSYT